MSYLPKIQEDLSIAKVRELNPLVLAYIGDGVQTLYTRTKYITKTTFKTNKLHLLVTNEVKAKAQAVMMDKILPLLTEEEMDIYHRARNTHVNTAAKNASLAEYMAATAFEAVIGYLYLSGQNDRLESLISKATENE